MSEHDGHAVGGRYGVGLVDDPTAGCPVCVTPVGDQERCARCGWRLRGELVLGAVDSALRTAFDAELGAACRRFDLAAAALAAGYPAASGRDPARIGQFASLVRSADRGGSAMPHPEDLAGWQDAVRSLPLGAAVDAARAQGTILDAVSAALGRLVRAESAAVVLADLGPDGIDTLTLAADPLGVVAAAGRSTYPWSRLVSGLPTDHLRSAFTRAGGRQPAGATPGPAVGTANDDLARQAALDGPDAAGLLRALTDPTTDPILLLRTPGWAVPEELAARVAAARPADGTHLVRLYPDADWRLAGTDVASLGRLAPLRHGYGLLTAVVDAASGVPRHGILPLFPAGTRADGTPPARVHVRVHRTAGAPVALAVVAQTGASAADQHPQVARVQTRLPAGAEHLVEIVLRGPGEVDLTRPESVTEDRRPWSEVTRLPATVDLRAAVPVDLVFAVELGGAARAVARRVRLIAETINLVDEQHPRPATIRYGLLPYVDHAADLVGSPVQGARFGMTAAQALAESGALTSRRIVHEDAAPVEDALAAAAGLRWVDPGHRVLVVIGARAPHPSGAQAGVQRCTSGLEFRTQLDRLRRDHRVRIVALWDQPAWAGDNQRRTDRWTRTRDGWGELAGSRRIPLLDGVSAQTLAQGTGLLPTTTADLLLLPYTLAGSTHAAGAI